jgi:ketosteroid isomerase-like protein
VHALDEIRERLERAENGHDAQTFVDLLADDVAVMVPDHAVQEGKSAAAAFVRGMTDWMRENLDRHIAYTSTEVTEVGELGFDRGTFAFTVGWRKGGERKIVRGKYLYVYRRDAAAWKLWRVMMSTDENDEKLEETP